MKTSRMLGTLVAYLILLPMSGAGCKHRNCEFPGDYLCDDVYPLSGGPSIGEAYSVCESACGDAWESDKKGCLFPRGLDCGPGRPDTCPAAAPSCNVNYSVCLCK